jgi:hypothetical protein
MDLNCSPSEQCRLSTACEREVDYHNERQVERYQKCNAKTMLSDCANGISMGCHTVSTPCWADQHWSNPITLLKG